jgi:hypothetical protein
LCVAAFLSGKGLSVAPNHLQLVKTSPQPTSLTPALHQETRHGVGVALDPTSLNTLCSDGRHEGTLMELPEPATDVGDLRQGLTDLVHGVMRTNLRISQELLHVTDYNQFVRLQRRFIGDYMVTLINGVQSIATLQRTAGESASRERRGQGRAGRP